MNLQIRDLDKKTKFILTKEVKIEPVGLEIEVRATKLKPTIHCTICKARFKSNKIPDHFTKTGYHLSEKLCKGSYSQLKSDKFEVSFLDEVKVYHGIETYETFTVGDEVILDFTNRSNYGGIDSNYLFNESFFKNGIIVELNNLVESKIKSIHNETWFKNNGEVYSSITYFTFNNLNLDLPTYLFRNRIIKI